MLRLIAEYQSRAGATVETDNERISDAVREIIDATHQPHEQYGS